MQPNIFKTSMTNGLIVGVLFSLKFLLSTSKGLLFNSLSFILFIAIILVMYKMAVSFRDRQLKGFISYWGVVNLTIMTFFFAALISAAFKMVYTSYINPEFLPTLTAETLQALETLQPSFNIFSYIDEDEYLKAFEKQMQPYNYSIQTIWVNVLAGLGLGLVLGAFVMKKRGLFDEEPTEENTEQTTNNE